MKLMCPHCGVKGTADDALMEKKVRCPQCQKIFRLNETTTLSAESTPKPQVAQTGIVPPAQELGTCSVCGFSLSSTYLQEKDAKLYCRICLPA